MRETVVSVVDCPWCGEPMDLVVDPSGGRQQSYVEDCWVCCHPCVITVVEREEGELEVSAVAEA